MLLIHHKKHYNYCYSLNVILFPIKERALWLVYRVPHKTFSLFEIIWNTKYLILILNFPTIPIKISIKLISKVLESLIKFFYFFEREQNMYFLGKFGIAQSRHLLWHYNTMPTCQSLRIKWCLIFFLHNIWF